VPEGREATESRKEGEQMRHPLIPVNDIPESGSVSADLLGREVLVTMLNGKPRAFINVCMHHGGPLVLEDDRFTCQWHGAQYDARTGHALSGPVRPDARLIMLPTRVEEGILVYVYKEDSNERRESAAAIVV
jgi:nitrite reductase/ring-hydroxylating ferredoxin subunit